MAKRAEFKYNVLLQNKKKQYEKNYEYEIEKNRRKLNSYIKKMEDKYRKKMLNEIRLVEWKKQREYKSAKPKIKPIEFAMQIAQENARLRQTDENGYGRCISHKDNQIFAWGKLAGWHRYSRRFKTICLELENINAQCHDCNNATWPLGNVELKARTNMRYDENLDKLYGEWTAEKLHQKYIAHMHWEREAYDLDKMIPELIDENERLWKTKNFYAPWKKWRAIWTKYKA